jgi:hypothetical protein
VDRSAVVAASMVAVHFAVGIRSTAAEATEGSMAEVVTADAGKGLAYTGILR